MLLNFDGTPYYVDASMELGGEKKEKAKKKKEKAEQSNSESDEKDAKRAKKLIEVEVEEREKTTIKISTQLQLDAWGAIQSAAVRQLRVEAEKLQMKAATMTHQAQLMEQAQAKALEVFAKNKFVRVPKKLA